MSDRLPLHPDAGVWTSDIERRVAVLEEFVGRKEMTEPSLASRLYRAADFLTGVCNSNGDYSPEFMERLVDARGALIEAASIVEQVMPEGELLSRLDALTVTEAPKE